jgi:hypothetical protein
MIEREWFSLDGPMMFEEMIAVPHPYDEDQVRSCVGVALVRLEKIVDQWLGDESGYDANYADQNGKTVRGTNVETVHHRDPTSLYVCVSRRVGRLSVPGRKETEVAG